jgi:hypothetical protein
MAVGMDQSKLNEGNVAWTIPFIESLKVQVQQKWKDIVSLLAGCALR